MNVPESQVRKWLFNTKMAAPCHLVVSLRAYPHKSVQKTKRIPMREKEGKQNVIENYSVIP